MAVDPHADVTYAELVEFCTHLVGDGDYRRLFGAAAVATSPQDRRRNQSIKFLRQAALYDCARQVLRDRVAGAFAECGCFRGQASYLLASMVAEAKAARNLHVFDSFEGLSSFEDADRAGIERDAAREARMRAHFAWPEESFRQVMAVFGNAVKSYRGWIPDRFPEVADETFALVHIDVDLYQPTRDSLEFFYPRLAPGGWIVIDDYNTLPYPGANTAVDAFVATIDPACAVPGQIGGFLIRKRDT